MDNLTETIVLGSILLEPAVLADLDGKVDTGDFQTYMGRRSWAVFGDLVTSGRPIDILSLRNGLVAGGVSRKEAQAYVAELSTAPRSTGEILGYAAELRDVALKRDVMRSVRLIADTTEGLTGADALDAAEAAIMSIRRREIGGSMVHVRQILPEVMEIIEGEAELGVETGFHAVDQLLGSLRKGELIILAARPSMGKTAFAMNIVTNAAISGKKVAVFSLETKRERLVLNMVIAHANVSGRRVTQKAILPDEATAMMDSMAALELLDIHIMDRFTMTPSALTSQCRRLAADGKLDLVVLDYIQLMKSPSGDSRQQQVGELSRALKCLAGEMHCPVLCLAQLSRKCEERPDRRPRLPDLRESGDLEQDADAVMLLFREEYYFPDKQETKGMAEVILAKHRNGLTGTASLRWRGDNIKFKNVDIYDIGH